MSAETIPEPVPAPEKQPPVRAPEGREPGAWAERAEKALEARTLGRKLRMGKRVQFGSRHHLAR